MGATRKEPDAHNIPIEIRKEMNAENQEFMKRQLSELNSGLLPDTGIDRVIRSTGSSFLMREIISASKLNA